ncbi:MAG TPA: hypothetical protein VG713_10770, partial [Pirellulales bacterium]|nr:hypothetical protein [Pirellulales bacterium]
IMPLKLNIGLSKKTGELNYGSRGASVNLELDLGLVDQPDRLRERVRHLFTLAKASVEEELASNAAPTNGAASLNGHERQRDNGRRATASQVRALQAICTRQGLDLAALVNDHFGTRDPANLSITEASELIDQLKQAGNGKAGKR